MPDDEIIERCVMAANSQFIGESDIINIIKAMREPTGKMLNAENVHTKCYTCGGHLEGWHAMIDEILK